MSPSITRRRVRSDDEPFLFEVYASTRAEELAVVDWDDEQRHEFLVMQFRAQDADYRRRFPDGEHDILLVDGTPVGQVWTGHWPDEIRLLDIALLPERRNEGIGTAVVTRLQTEAVAAGLPLRHAVLAANVDGLRFYRRLGFEVVEDFEMYVLMEWTQRTDRPAT